MNGLTQEKNTANNEDEHVASKVTKEVHSIVKLLDSKQHIPHTKKDGKNNMDNANEEGKPQNAKTDLQEMNVNDARHVSFESSQSISNSDQHLSKDPTLRGEVDSISKDLATYINNEGHLTLDERHCEEHVKACR